MHRDGSPTAASVSAGDAAGGGATAEDCDSGGVGGDGGSTQSALVPVAHEAHADGEEEQNVVALARWEQVEQSSPPRQQRDTVGKPRRRERRRAPVVAVDNAASLRIVGAALDPATRAADGASSRLATACGVTAGVCGAGDASSRVLVS